MCDATWTSGIYVATVWPRMEKKKNEKEAQNLYPNKYITKCTNESWFEDVHTRILESARQRKVLSNSLGLVDQPV